MPAGTRCGGTGTVQALVLYSPCKACSHSAGEDVHYCTHYFQSELNQMVAQRQDLIEIMCEGGIFKFPLAMHSKTFWIFVSKCVLVLALYLHLEAKTNCFQYKYHI